MICSELWKQWTLTRINGGHYDWWYFPFQLCSLPMYLLIAVTFIRHLKIRQIIYTFFMDYCLLCGTFVFFDISGMIYPTILLTIHSFSWHILLIALGIMAGLSGRADYSGQGFFKGSLIFIIGCIIATLFNLSLYPLGSINMFYISPYYRMDQVVFRSLSQISGNSVGILSYILAIISGAFLFHLFWLKKQKSRR